MHKVTIPIVPYQAEFIGTKDTLDLKAICIFAAIGFFLDTDTFYKGLKTLRPATNNLVNKTFTQSSDEKHYFKWHYSPVERPLNQIVEEFATLFETIIEEQVKDKIVILPLSGGLDSRTQATALRHLGKTVNAYSYEFTNGHNETKYSGKIAKACGFPFQKWRVPEGYLWDSIEELGEINQCYSEFTHPRQMAFIGNYSALGDLFSLGHLGDLLFDDMRITDDMTFENQINYLYKMTVKKGGEELGNLLWKSWKLEGDFKEYLFSRLKTLLLNINIPESANARLRAFKSTYYVHRWTNTNLAVFAKVKPISLPYYDNRMCEFVCSIPEKYLANRQIQIAYIKMRNPALAAISWEAQRPFNLYNYHFNKIPYNLPFRIYDKTKRLLKPNFTVQRNWELQFLGEKNEMQIRKWLLENPNFDNFINNDVSRKILNKFHTDNKVFYSHPLSMLVTLAVFAKQNNI